MRSRPPLLGELGGASDIRATARPLLRQLERPEVPIVAVALGVVLCLPAVFSGFALDDHLQRLAAFDSPLSPDTRPAYDLFRFVDGDAATLTALADRSGLWSIPPEYKLTFFRPLASLTHAFEYALWPDQAWLMHLQNLAWYALLIFFASALFQNFIGVGWVAAAATILFAVDDAHGIPAGWIANRHALMAACFGCLAIAVHDRCRRDRWQPGMILGPAFFALALLSSESGIATGAYIVAYALVFDADDRSAQAMSVAPYLAVGLLWLALHSLLGYGTVGSALYLDPLREPGAFTIALVERLPVLGLAQLGLPGAEVNGFLPGWARLLHTTLGAVVVAGVVWVIWPLLQVRREARFFALGAAFSLVPIALTHPGDRLLVFSSIGAMAVVAQFFAAVLHTARNGALASLRLPVVAVFLAWVLLHIIVSPLLLPVRALSPWFIDGMVAEAAATIPDDDTLAQQQLVAVNAPNLAASVFALVRRASLGETLPASARFLAIQDGPVTLRRTEEDSVVVTLPQGQRRVPGNLGEPPRSTAERFRLAVDERIELDGFWATILAVDEQGPTKIRFRFDVPCDNPSLRWIAWDGDGYVPFDPPGIGKRVVVGGN